MSESKFRTAVVVVHGMGEQKPLDTVNSFVKTALAEIGGERVYYSRPAKIAESYEARRLLAIERDEGDAFQTQTEIYEYHWSYMMTGNKIADVLPTSLRLLGRPPWRLPVQLRAPWIVLVSALLVLAWRLWEARRDVEEWTTAGVIKALFPSVFIAAVVALLVSWLVGKTTSFLVDVVRYLDRSPRSYEVRRAIRGGMVDLLRHLHETKRYSRIVVVAHSLGGFIAYDGLTTLWDETDRGEDGRLTFDRLEDLQHAALAVRAETSGTTVSNQIDEGPDTSRAKSDGDGRPESVRVQGRPPADGSDCAHDDEIDYGPTDPGVKAVRAAQLALWEEMRDRGVDWLVTDFITLGTPMYFADVLYTKNLEQFGDLVKRSELAQCPPRSDSETVESDSEPALMYGRTVRGRLERRLVTGSPFAVVRWSNFWFPAVGGVFGDPFGGSLLSLFGAGIDNRPVTADKKGRYLPLWAHTKYFSYPGSVGPDFVAPVIRKALALDYQYPPASAASK